MRVMLDIFSGRPNPIWQIPTATARHVLHLHSRQDGSVKKVRPPVLGYRGFLVESEPEDGTGYTSLVVGISAPAQIRDGGVPIAAQRTVLPDTEREIALVLLDSARSLINRDVINEAARVIERRGDVAMKTTGTDVSPTQDVPKLMAPCEPILSAYRPWFWNEISVRLRNNCYNYASNYVSNFVAQPGRKAGQMYHEFTCDGIAAAAIADGYREDCNGPARLVALVVWPGQDFHWYRSHGIFWAHKLGIYSARNFDNRGRVIADGLTPATCDRGPYTQFCRYMYVPPGVEVL